MSNIPNIDRYNACLAESKRLGEWNDCCVIATAMIYDISYMEAHDIIAELGRKAGCGHNMFTVINKLGKDQPINKIRKPDNKGKYTVKTIVHELPIGKFFIFTAGHVLACIDGTIYDWTEDRKHRVDFIIEIDKAISWTELL